MPMFRVWTSSWSVFPAPSVILIVTVVASGSAASKSNVMPVVFVGCALIPDTSEMVAPVDVRFTVTAPMFGGVSSSVRLVTNLTGGLFAAMLFPLTSVMPARTVTKYS